MSEEPNLDLQDWFNRSIERIPNRPFTVQVVAMVRRQDRLQRLRAYAAVLVALFAFALLLPDVVELLNSLAILPAMLVADAVSMWPAELMLAAAPIYWLIHHAQNRGFFRGGS